MHHECRFVGVGQILPIRIEMRGVLGGARAAVLERVANSPPRLSLDWRHEASGTRG